MARDLQRFYIKAGIDFKMVMYLCTNDNTFLIQSAQFFRSCSFAAKFSCCILSCLISGTFNSLKLIFYEEKIRYNRTDRRLRYKQSNYQSVETTREGKNKDT